MSNKLVKISGRKVTLIYNDPNAFYFTGEDADPMAHGTNRDCLAGYGVIFYNGGKKMDDWYKSLSKTERFVLDHKSCFPLEKQPVLKGTLAEIQAYGYLPCVNGMTIWQNWLRY
jgi:hypothetical protein